MHTVTSSTDTPSRKVRGDWTPINYDLRDTWFPVSHSRDLSAQPIRRIIHANPITCGGKTGSREQLNFIPIACVTMRAC
jgi:hypothetical protein